MSNFFAIKPYSSTLQSFGDLGMEEVIYGDVVVLTADDWEQVCRQMLGINSATPIPNDLYYVLFDINKLCESVGTKLSSVDIIAYEVHKWKENNKY